MPLGGIERKLQFKTSKQFQVARKEVYLFGQLVKLTAGGKNLLTDFWIRKILK